MLPLAKQGQLHQASGVYGFSDIGGNPATGMISLGQDYFYMSKSGVITEEGLKKQLGYAQLYHLNRATGIFTQKK
jgi:hypothetical protein